MATYVLMTKLGHTSLQDPRGRRKVGSEWKHMVEKLCPNVHWVGHYALLGRYDFMTIFEAPDDETAMKVSLLSREHGAVSAESWPATPYESFLKIADEVEKEKARSM